MNFEEIIRVLNAAVYDGPLSVEWEDSGMDRVDGTTEAAAFVKKVDFKPSKQLFRARLYTEKEVIRGFTPLRFACFSIILPIRFAMPRDRKMRGGLVPASSAIIRAKSLKRTS